MQPSPYKMVCKTKFEMDRDSSSHSELLFNLLRHPAQFTQKTVSTTFGIFSKAFKFQGPCLHPQVGYAATKFCMIKQERKFLEGRACSLRWPKISDTKADVRSVYSKLSCYKFFLMARCLTATNHVTCIAINQSQRPAKSI